MASEHGSACIVVHGGAWAIPDRWKDSSVEGVKSAAVTGHQILMKASAGTFTIADRLHTEQIQVPPGFFKLPSLAQLDLVEFGSVTLFSCKVINHPFIPTIEFNIRCLAVLAYKFEDSIIAYQPTLSLSAPFLTWKSHIGGLHWNATLFKITDCTFWSQNWKEHIRISPDMGFWLSIVHFGEVVAIFFSHSTTMLVERSCQPTWRPITRKTNWTWFVTQFHFFTLLVHSSQVNSKTFPKKNLKVQPQGSILFGLERDKQLDCHGIQTSIAPGRYFVSTQNLASNLNA